MSALGFLLIGIVIALPIAWLVSEFRGSRVLRISFGILAIGVIGICTWALSSLVTRLNYNSWYGGATGDLIGTSLQQVEQGHLDRVLKVWRGLEQQYQPTYENRAHYDELIKEATARMRGDAPIEAGSTWDAPNFRPESWLGHWEDGYGYWIVINDVGRPFNVVQSGQLRAKVHDVSVSPDFRVLKFKEGDQWQHTLTLKNGHEASYEWFDLQKGTVWQTRLVHKLIRASSERQAMAQPGGPVTGSQPMPLETNRTSSPADSRR